MDENCSTLVLTELRLCSCRPVGITGSSCSASGEESSLWGCCAAAVGWLGASSPVDVKVRSGTGSLGVVSLLFMAQRGDYSGIFGGVLHHCQRTVTSGLINNH